MREKKKPGAMYYIINVIAFIIFISSATFYLYPVVSNMWNRYRNSQLIVEYSGVVEELDEDQYEEIWEAAREYNEQHTVNTIIDAFDEDTEEYILTHPYDTLLNPTGNEVMGYLEIPCIDVRLAIYHGIGSDSLEKGAGHIEGTSLPIGGPGTHTVLSAHRGLPTAKLFTDLDVVKEGDIFIIHVLGVAMAYEVDQILTVLPHETEDLAIVEGEDLATLVTCTPYAVNTHRLLVRGHRTEYVPDNTKESDSLVETIVPESDRTLFYTIISGAGCLVLALIFLIIKTIRRKIINRKRNNSGKGM